MGSGYACALDPEPAAVAGDVVRPFYVDPLAPWSPGSEVASADEIGDAEKKDGEEQRQQQEKQPIGM